jgi:hypothetical protein
MNHKKCKMKIIINQKNLLAKNNNVKKINKAQIQITNKAMSKVMKINRKRWRFLAIKWYKKNNNKNKCNRKIF